MNSRYQDQVFLTAIICRGLSELIYRSFKIPHHSIITIRFSEVKKESSKMISMFFFFDETPCTTPNVVSQNKVCNKITPCAWLNALSYVHIALEIYDPLECFMHAIWFSSYFPKTSIKVKKAYTYKVVKAKTSIAITLKINS